MTFVATLISNPAAPALDAAAIERARAALPSPQAPNWLDPGIAADIPFIATRTNSQVIDSRAVAGRVRTALAGAAIDVVVQPAGGRRKALFLADMDSTMIGQECIDELIRLTSGARTLVATLRGNGAYTCLVTGGFTLFSRRIAALIGFDENRANTLVIDGDGRLTGDVSEPIFGREAKLATLIELTRKLALTPERTLVAGDGANDIAMIQAAGLGVAYHAKPKVAEAAAARIDHGDLTALLYAQGYRRDEFVSVEG